MFPCRGTKWRDTCLNQVSLIRVDHHLTDPQKRALCPVHQQVIPKQQVVPEQYEYITATLFPSRESRYRHSLEKRSET